MKNFIIAIIAIFCIFNVQNTIAQSNTGGQEIKAITTAVPVFQKVLLLATDAKRSKVTVPALDGRISEIDAKIAILHKGTTIEEIEIITGAYDAKYKTRVTKNRISQKNGELAQFTVKGHPKGTFIVSFKATDNPSSTRQKNRRVEMTVVFE